MQYIWHKLWMNAPYQSSLCVSCTKCYRRPPLPWRAHFEKPRFRGDSTWYFIFMKRVAVKTFYNRIIIKNHNSNRNILLVHTKVWTACQWKSKLFPVGIISTFYMNFWSGVQQITTSTHEHEKTFHLSRLHLVAAFGHRLFAVLLKQARCRVCSRLNSPLLLVMGL